jgi:hypothetical protein
MLACVLSLIGSLLYWVNESTYQRQSPDPYRIADQAARFAGLRGAVPVDAIVGYLADLPPEDTTAQVMFLAAQYHLAPRLLQKRDDYDFVLGNFTRPADFASIGRQHGLRIERDFGNGVVLFRKEASR